MTRPAGFPKLFRRLRKDASKTLMDVARHLDVSVTFISDVEQGRRSMSPERVRQAAECFGIDPAELFAAASEGRGAFELAADNMTEAKRTAGASLMREWSSMTEEEFKSLVEFMGSMRKQGGS